MGVASRGLQKRQQKQRIKLKNLKYGEMKQ